MDPPAAGASGSEGSLGADPLFLSSLCWGLSFWLGAWLFPPPQPASRERTMTDARIMLRSFFMSNSS